MIRFVWSGLVHAPYPSRLAFVCCHSWSYLLGSKRVDIHEGVHTVQFLVCVDFDVRFLHTHFSYHGRRIATPYLSCLNLVDTVNDWRLLGNAVYLPANSYFVRSFRDFFTGSDDLGFYDLGSSQLGRYYWEEHCFAKYVDVGYCVSDVLTRKRISDVFRWYSSAVDFAEKVFYGTRSKVDGIRFVPYGNYLRIDVICVYITKITHPLGLFSFVRTRNRTVSVSELLSHFRDILVAGGEGIDQIYLG